MTQQCPQCTLINPPAALRCDCGYDLAKRPALSASPVDLVALFMSFEGRIGRSTYWLKFLLPYLGIYFVLLVLDITLGTPGGREGLGIFSGIFLLLALLPSIAVGVKRCHDRDRSGWFLLLSVIPLLNFWTMIELWFLPGSPGGNKYGLPEQPTRDGSAASPMLNCPECSAPYDPADYRMDMQTIYCSVCRAELPRGHSAS